MESSCLLSSRDHEPINGGGYITSQSCTLVEVLWPKARTVLKVPTGVDTGKDIVEPLEDNLGTRIPT